MKASTPKASKKPTDGNLSKKRQGEVGLDHPEAPSSQDRQPNHHFSQATTTSPCERARLPKPGPLGRLSSETAQKTNKKQKTTVFHGFLMMFDSLQCFHPTKLVFTVFTGNQNMCTGC